MDPYSLATRLGGAIFRAAIVAGCVFLLLLWVANIAGFILGYEQSESLPLW